MLRAPSNLQESPAYRPGVDELDRFRFTVARNGGENGVPVLISRTGFTGELGYEIFCSPRDAEQVFDLITAAGAKHGLAPVGVSLPLHAAEHFYIVTEVIPDLPRNLPVLFVSDECAYFKEDAGKILLGCFEPKAKPWGHNGIPEDFCFDSLPEDFEHFEPILEMAVNRAPILANAGIQLFFNGPESFTPDDRYLLGETPEVENLFCACGFNSVGILSSGGVGKSLAAWISNGEPPMDLLDVDVRRMQPFQKNRQYLYERTTETLGALMDMHWPHKQWETSRDLRRSALHDRLLARGAVMTEAAAYERPGFFAKGSEPRDWTYSYSHQSWFGSVAREVANTSNCVTVTDQSCFTKFIVEGRDATTILNRICAADVDVPVGRLVYSQWLTKMAA